MGIRFNPFTGNLDYIGSSASGPATDAPKLLETFDCDSGLAVGDFVVVDGDNTVATVSDNAIATIPKGIFGVAYSKPTSTTVRVLFTGIMDGYSGLTFGDAVYVGTLGEPSNAAPATGVVQQIGFAISSTEFFVQLMQPFARES